ncbi:MAG: hypothetical protein AB9836_12405 [Aminipila sp.]
MDYGKEAVRLLEDILEKLKMIDYKMSEEDSNMRRLCDKVSEIENTVNTIARK